MSRFIKINTAVIICLAFVVRILFLNVGMFASVAKTDQLRAKHSFTLKKRKIVAEVNEVSNTKDYSAVEFCEEDSDNEDDQKINPPVLLSILYTFLDKLSFIQKLSFPFDRIKGDLYSKRYLSLSILRI